jgi:hypothetical protein
LNLLEEIVSYNNIIKELENSNGEFDEARLEYCLARREKLLKKLVKQVDKELAEI